MSEHNEDKWIGKITEKIREYQYQGDLPEGQVDKFFGERMEPKKGSGIWLKVAASVAILVLAAWGFYAANSVTEVNGRGTLSTLELPDGSEVRLGYDSELRYNRLAWRFERELELEGEAYFDVIPGSTFTVTSASGSTTVLGTRFSIRTHGVAYRVECFEGKVSVLSGTVNRELMAGEGVSIAYDLDEDLQVKTEIPDWMTDEMTFDEVRLGEVADILSRTYDVDFEGIEEFEDEVYTGFFPTDDLETALQVVFEPMAISYKKKEKKKVILTRKKKQE